jgi:hypothetical protein
VVKGGENKEIKSKERKQNKTQIKSEKLEREKHM